MTQPAVRATEAGWESGVVGSGEVKRDAGGAQAVWMGSGDSREGVLLMYSVLLFLLSVFVSVICSMKGVRVKLCVMLKGVNRIFFQPYINNST